MRGHVLLSHGSESGPDSTKVSVLAEVAESLGFVATRVDYRACGIGINTVDIEARLQLGLDATKKFAPEIPLILVGSSMGAFISGLISTRVECDGLFLLAPPIRLGDYPNNLEVSDAPLVMIHGWDDELIPVDEVIDYAAENGAELHLLNDDHRLADYVGTIARWFAEFLDRVVPEHDAQSNPDAKREMQ